MQIPIPYPESNKNIEDIIVQMKLAAINAQMKYLKGSTFFMFDPMQIEMGKYWFRAFEPFPSMALGSPFLLLHRMRLGREEV